MLSSDVYESRSWDLFCADEFLEAADMLREGLRFYPDNLELQMHRIISLGNADEFGELVVAYRKYYAMGGRDITARVWYAIALNRLGRCSEVLTVLATLSEQEQLDLADGVQAMLSLTRVARHKPLRAKAASVGLKLARKLVGLYPEEAEPHFAVGYWMSTTRKCTKKALAHLAKGVELAPDRHDFRVYYGNGLYEMGRDEEALAEWAKVPVGEIDCSMALRRMMGVYTSKGHHEESAACEARLKEVEEKDCQKTSLSDADVQRLMGALT